MPNVALAFLLFSQGVQIRFFSFIISRVGIGGSVAHTASQESWNRCFITCNIVIKAELYFWVLRRQKGKMIPAFDCTASLVPLPSTCLLWVLCSRFGLGVHSGKLHVPETWELFWIRGRYEFCVYNKMAATIVNDFCSEYFSYGN